MMYQQSGTNRIALFVPSLRGGGAERVMVNLSHGFSERGISVDLVLFNLKGPYSGELPQGVRVVNLGASRLLKGLPKLVTYLKNERPSVVLSAMKHANVTLLLAALLARTHVPVVISEHNTASVSEDLNFGIKGAILRLLIRFLYPLANNVVAVSSGVAEDIKSMIKLNSENVRVIYNPIVDAKLLSLMNQPVSHPWLLDRSLPVVLAAGRLTPQKDFETLLCAFDIAQKQRPMRLIILGEGELLAELEAMVQRLGISDIVGLPGFVGNPYSYMKRANVFVLSSRWEGFGNVLVEAIACDTPVISTDCPSGPSEILDNGKWGRLVSVGDAEGMAQSILEVLNNRGSSQKARAMEFTVQRAVDAYLDLLLPYYQKK